MPAMPQRRGASRSSSASNATQSKKRKSDKDKLVLSVSNLSRNVNEDHLREIFGNYGKVREATLAIDKAVGLPKGYAYVEFSSEREAERAISYLNGGQIDGNVVKVEFQSDRKRKAQKKASQQERERNPDQKDKVDREKERDKAADRNRDKENHKEK